MIQMIDNGATHPNRLIEFLKNLNQNCEYADTPSFGLSKIVNRKGEWTLEFDELPSMGNLLGILAFFENEQHWDTLYEIVFNVGTGEEVRYSNVAGTDRRSYHHLAHLVCVVAIATEDRYAAFRKLREQASEPAPKKKLSKLPSLKDIMNNRNSDMPF